MAFLSLVTISIHVFLAAETLFDLFFMRREKYRHTRDAQPISATVHKVRVGAISRAETLHTLSKKLTLLRAAVQTVISARSSSSSSSPSS